MRRIHCYFRFGDLNAAVSSLPGGPLDYFGKRGIIIMKSTPRTTQNMARQAFGLLLELRARQDAHQCLAKALAFLEVLVREKNVNSAPIMLSVRVMQLRKS